MANYLKTFRVNLKLNIFIEEIEKGYNYFNLKLKVEINSDKNLQIIGKRRGNYI